MSACSIGVDAHDMPAVPSGFEVQRLLGRGSSAVVWLARHTATGEDVALKVWRRPLAGEYEKRRFSNECRWHRELSGHPNIVDWFWASSPDESNPWTATRPHGTSLDRHLAENGPPTLDAAFALSLDLLDGLAAMHRRGLIHRDVKPGNVLVQEGRAALCDLGIAMPVDELTREYRAGTSGYLAPELDEGGDPSQQPDRRSDVYSAAVTISRMIGDDAPHAVDHLVNARAGSSRREDRPRDAAEFGRELRAAIRASTTSAGPGPDRRGGRPPHPRRGLRAVVVAAAATVALAGSALVGAAVTRRNTTGSTSTSRPRASTAVPAATATPRASTAAPAATATPRASTAAPATTDTPQARTPVASGGEVTGALGAMAAAPDIGPGRQPVLRDVRPSGRCDGQPVPGGTQVHRAGGLALAVTRVYYDTRGQVCAIVEKTQEGGLYNERSYLALSLCNARGQCDHDWSQYRINAGPVTVGAADGCVTWRVSAMDAAGRHWLIEDQLGLAGCR